MTLPMTTAGEPDLFEEKPLKLDFGCGRNPRPEFEGVDAIDFGQKHVMDLRRTWPWKDQTVDEAFSSHFVEHLDGPERVFFMNELYRVMKFGATAVIITPHWSNDCAYGDPTHKWPPLSNWSAQYWNKAWRDMNAPHCGYTCDFDWVIGVGWDAAVVNFNQERQMYMANHDRNAVRDIYFNLTKVKR